MSDKAMSPAVDVWLEVRGRHAVGKREAEILEGVRRFGSLIATARALGISYAHAWESLTRLSETLGSPLVEARRGGRSGGGAKLTNVGIATLARYRALERRAKTLLANKRLGRGTPPSILRPPSLPDFAMIGSDCDGVRILLGLMLKKKRFSYEYVSVGSTGGLAAVMLGEADVAGVHLFDQETQQFNLPFLKRYWLDRRAVLVRGYDRQQGFIVARGNPKRINDVEDILKIRARLANRILGSGTRALFDNLLADFAGDRGKQLSEVSRLIKGYDIELRTHDEVASAVAEGRADVGFGMASAAAQHGLGFIPVLKERFDFVLEERRLRRPLVKLFLSVLSSKKFPQHLRSRSSGLVTSSETGKILYRPAP